MKKIPIWGDVIPYNSSRSKLPDMKIDYKKKSKSMAMLRYAMSGIRGDAFHDSRSVTDTWTYLAEIRPGFSKETYEDVPYITPFLVPGSRRAVLIVPGGGFSYKQSDLDGEGKQGEGDLVAKELNRAGISAFVLWYRTNPYRFPVPLMDMQRAVRFIRFHAEEFGLNPNKISAIGFSAGGYEVAGLMNLLHGESVFPSDYTADEVDATSDQLETAGLIYPCVSFQCLYPLMNACFTEEQLNSEEKRQSLYKRYSCVENYCSEKTPQFFCYGGKDTSIPLVHEQAYLAKLKETRTDHKVLFLPSAPHGFGAHPVKMKKYGWWISEYLDWYNLQTQSQ